MKLFDSHCHLTDERLRGDADAVVDRAREAGLTGLVTIASSLVDARAARDLAARHEDVWFTAGVHPHEAADVERATIDELRELTGADAPVALGETGLDFHYDSAPRAAQRRSFDWQLELAAETGLPVVVHARDADGDVAAAIRAAGADVTGVLHCFAGGSALLDAALEEGWCVSFAGLVSFARWDGADLLRAVPDDRLLVETDSPYLAPVPHRGRTNEPAFVRHVVDAIARLRGADADATAALTEVNARRFYRLESS
ncbi:MAG TPA: TatD family hydrolase [Longimicrobiales bacterium]|nr:TatD family hydrolase [Longimicrobiales bacterium]